MVTTRTFLSEGWPRRIVLLGYFLPILVGVLVREYLVMVGKPVMPWGWFFNPGRVFQMVFLLAYWDVPFLIVAALVARNSAGDNKNTHLAWGAFLGTLLFSLAVFGFLWMSVEAIYMLAPVIPFFVLVGTIMGGGIGWSAGRIRQGPKRVQQHRS